ncbi:MAG: hypothetical protein SFT81_05520 [Candidatus Caenarcaniphilales bacterium]|nr:hypothetical protein [Candidatus Caenarcaniphilales bacterium]
MKRQFLSIIGIALVLMMFMPAGQAEARLSSRARRAILITAGVAAVGFSGYAIGRWGARKTLPYIIPAAAAVGGYAIGRWHERRIQTGR